MCKFFFTCLNPCYTRVASVKRSHRVLKIADRRGARCTVASNAVHASLSLPRTPCGVIKTVLSSGYILILLSIEYILTSLIKMCQG